MFAMLVDSDTYAPSLVKFLNRFSKEAQNNTPEFNSYLARLFQSFLKAVEHLPDDTFINKGNNRINVALFEAVFYAASKGSFASEELISILRESKGELFKASPTNGPLSWGRGLEPAPDLIRGRGRKRDVDDAACRGGSGTAPLVADQSLTRRVLPHPHAAHAAESTSACSRTVWVAFSCLSGG